jgi:hypothetical protein
MNEDTGLIFGLFFGLGVLVWGCLYLNMTWDLRDKKQAMELGYVQQQCVGTSGHIWVKIGEGK